MAEDVTTACKDDDLTKPTGSLIFSKEKVAVTEISLKSHEMCMSPKVMGLINTAGGTHSVSEMRQINMAGNI